MKEILLKHITKGVYRQSDYFISINGSKYDFSNYKEANAFIASLNKKLTRIIRELNEIYASVLPVTQRFIFDLEHSQIRRYLELKAQIDERMHFILWRYTAKEPSFIIHTFFYIANQLNELIFFAKIHIKKIAYTGFELSLDMLQNQISEIIKSIRIIGKIDNVEYSIKDYQTKYMSHINYATG